MQSSGTSSAIPRAIADLCPQCKGAGWLKRYHNGHDISGGSELVRCSCRHEIDQYKVWGRARNACGLLAALHHMTFDNYSRVRQPHAYDKAGEFCTDPAASWLVLAGEVGTGKTHLAAAIVNRLLASQKWHPVYHFVPDLLWHLRQGFDAGDHARRWSDVRDAQVLVLDDLGAEKGGQWSDETLFALIDHRWAMLKPTVVTTNYDMNQLPARISSRLSDRARSFVVVMRVGDYRRSAERAAERVVADPFEEINATEERERQAP